MVGVLGALALAGCSSPSHAPVHVSTVAVDTDHDGLTDRYETQGWNISVNTGADQPLKLTLTPMLADQELHGKVREQTSRQRRPTQVVAVDINAQRKKNQHEAGGHQPFAACRYPFDHGRAAVVEIKSGASSFRNSGKCTVQK